MKKLFLAALCATALTAHAEFWDGNKLLERLNGDPAESLSAGSYIAGVADALVGVIWCPPGTVTLGQVRDMTRLTLERSPEKRHLPADAFINITLRKEWPCKAKPGGSNI